MKSQFVSSIADAKERITTSRRILGQEQEEVSMCTYVVAVAPRAFVTLPQLLEKLREGIRRSLHYFELAGHRAQHSREVSWKGTPAHPHAPAVSYDQDSSAADMSLTDQLAYYEMEADAIKKVGRTMYKL